MMEFKSVPGYNPENFGSQSNMNATIRRWHPLVLSFLIFLTPYEWAPAWLPITLQITIGIIVGLIFSGLCFAIFSLKVLSLPMNSSFKSPLINSTSLLELFTNIILCCMLYVVNWPLTFAAYTSVNLLMVMLHFILLVRQARQKKS